MKTLRSSVLALSAVLFLSAYSSTPPQSQGVVMAPSSVECISVVNGEYWDECVIPLA